MSDFITPPPQPVAIPPAPPTPAAPKKRSAWFWLAVIGIPLVVVLGSFIGVVVYVAHSFNSSDSDDASLKLSSSQQIGVIEINGIILSSDVIDRQLRQFNDDSSVKAIVLRINSPGGGAAASQEIFHQVLTLRDQNKKPIVASIETVGASGAYYIASACDKIYANQASVVGSIGVILEWTNYGELLKWAHLKPVRLKAGELKDIGDPTRDMTPAEQAYLQTLVDNMHQQFIHDVAIGRHVDTKKLAPLADGRVWTGDQALPLGLIDANGGLRDAIMDTAKQVGIKGEPSIKKPARPRHGLVAILNGTDDDESGDDILHFNPTKLLDQSPGFYFLWK
jgi:protease-4